MSDTYCVLPFTHVCQTIDGRLKPCCRFQMDPADERRPHLKRMPMSAALTSEYFRGIQAAMKEGRVVDGCRRCANDERLGVRSYRQIANDNYAGRFPELSLSYVELAFSNECNLRCRMCHPTESRKWNADWPHVFPGRTDEIRDFAWDFTGDLAAFRDVRAIKVVGGEPFLSREHNAFLQGLAEVCDLSRLEIDYHTNGTLFPKPEIVAVLRRLRRARIHLSLDAVGPLAEYIRHGVAWEKIERVTAAWVALGRECPGVQISVFPTFQIYNAHAMVELMDWARAAGIADLGYSFVNEPEFLRLEILPPEYRRRLVERYARVPADEYPYSYAAALRFLSHRLQDETPVDPASLASFARYDRTLSRLRRQSLAAVAPELDALARTAGADDLEAEAAP